jgi:chlorophyll synthase
MSRATILTAHHSAPRPRDILALLKPITWFPPMWAFMCGVVSSGVSLADRWPFLIAGLLLAGPMVCGTSQAVNDWYDRHVDAINEPDRPIPSGRIAGSWGLYIAIIGTVLSLVMGAVIGPWVFAATILGLVLAWIYSAPPLRLKMSGWWGPGAVALSYEGLTWFTGAAVMLGAFPDTRIVTLILLYSLGAHGIMTLNDFKAIEGDRQMGIASLPARLGVDTAAQLACAIMAVPQAIIVVLLFEWQLNWYGAIVGLFLLLQCLLMIRLVGDPKARAPWYGGTGVTLYVLGMLASAIGIRGLA